MFCASDASLAALLVPKELNFLQMKQHKRVAADMLKRVNLDPIFMKRIVTDDDTWVYAYDMQTSQQKRDQYDRASIEFSRYSTL